MHRGWKAPHAGVVLAVIAVVATTAIFIGLLIIDAPVLLLAATGLVFQVAILVLMWALRRRASDAVRHE
ncbi:MAG: hypothetical protein M3O70_02380 [Actinomycetota bacterium]|nr:hypothetical protein [Actinomycetota bacterium]